MKSYFCSAGMRLAVIGGLTLLGAGCNAKAPDPGYSPGLGEIMTLTQMRHAKLWLAGEAGNWPLAGYEIDELEEGFADAVRYHPTHKDAPAPISELMPAMVTGPIRQLRQAVEAEDTAAFRQAFDALTGACNSCHRETRFGFNRVVRPSRNSFANQDFAPSAAGR